MAKSPDQTRKALLAAIHAANKELDLEEDTYRDLLEAEFGQRSAGTLQNGQLRRLLDIYQGWGWKSPRNKQAEALWVRARRLAEGLEDGPERLRGLVKKICGVDRLEWCRDAGKLRQLLAALGNIVDKYPDTPRDPASPTATP